MTFLSDYSDYGYEDQDESVFPASWSDEPDDQGNKIIYTDFPEQRDGDGELWRAAVRQQRLRQQRQRQRERRLRGKVQYLNKRGDNMNNQQLQPVTDTNPLSSGIMQPTVWIPLILFAGVLFFAWRGHMGGDRE